MRKIIYTLGILAVSAFAFSSCQKEQAINEDQPTSKLVTITFTAEKPGTDTRTAIGTEENGMVSYIWTDEDLANLKLFKVTETTGTEGGVTESLTQISNPTITKVSDTKLTISAEVEANATYTFRAILSNDWTGSGNNYASRKPKIKALQSPSGSTSFDPNSDILVSEDEVVTVDETGNTTGDMLLAFSRKVAVNKMTLKGMTAGEKIDKVIITSNNDLTGYLNGASMLGQTKTITVDYNDDVVPTGGLFPVFFVTMEGTDHSLTIEVKTDQHIYSKSFAEGKTIDFKVGQFTKFNVALPEGVSNTALSLPLSDPMDWAKTGGNDSTTELTVSDLTATQGDKKIYDSASKAYKGSDGLKFGSGSSTGSITTNNIDLSSAFYIAVEAKKYGSDAVKLSFAVDGNVVYTTPQNLTDSYETYHFNCSAATASSKITISTVSNTGNRGYINNLVIQSGTYVEPPVINITSTTPIEVDNTASSQTITYEIANSTDASLSASTEATWITNLNYATPGVVSFDVAAQESGAEARSAEIVLSYPGAKSKTVMVQQSAGAGGSTSFDYSFTAKNWTATRNGVTENWISGKDGYGYSNNGIQITKNSASANGTSPYTFTDIESITVTYCTNATSGVGSIKVTVGNGSSKTFNVTAPTSGGTSPKTTTFTYSPKESGSVTIEVTCSTNSVFLIGASIKAASINLPVSYSISCASGLEHGSIEANKNTAYEGEVITLTATPATGYQLGSWDVYKTGDPSTKVSVSGSSFTMPSYDVSVSASFVESASGSVTVSMDSFSSISGYVNDDQNVSYEASKGNAGTAPAVNNNQIRIYQNGGLLTITANNNKKISSITIGSAMATTVQTSVDSGDFSSDNNIAENGTYTISNIEASSVVFKCTGIDKNSRLYLNSLSVTYN